MKNPFASLIRLFHKPPADEPQDTEALRLAFQERYHHFKLLLNANNQALEIMTDLEEALQGKHPFGMSFIKSRCITLTVSVQRMLKHLEQLSDGRYNRLYEQFDEAWRRISELIEQKQEAPDNRYILPLSAIDRTMADRVGGKMANLGELRNKVHLQVPPGFVITGRAYQQFIDHNDLQSEIDGRFMAADITDLRTLFRLSEEIRQLIAQAEIPEDLATEIHRAGQVLAEETGGPVNVALRSSARGEDTLAHTFAGQYHSELNVPLAEVLTKYKAVVAGKYSLPAITYRLNHGIREEDITMSVGCLAMVDARSGGVIYTRNPIDTNDGSVFINSAWGLPKAVVDGNVSCDLFVVDRTPPLQITHRDIREKDSRFLCFAEDGQCRLAFSEADKDRPSLSGAEAIALAELAVRLEEHYGGAQDIEWAIDHDGSIHILQCRPLQQMDILDMDYPLDSDGETKQNVLASGGLVICPGVASGDVFRVNSPDDLVNFPPGGVLVVSQSLPVWAALLNRAAAVLTEQGTFASHLANVAREYKVPAIFGLAEITTRVKNGDPVTVDTSRASVYSGILEISRPSPPPGPEQQNQTPIFQTLQAVSRHILPLNLLDPYSPEFKADNCRTFHDITRFAHEKSVREMFNFGKEHNFSERSSRQLYYKVPMQWWILNLDDGVREEARGRYIHLEDITSLPMQALWEGFVAVPWDGPPPIDNRGLAAVIFRSTTNPDLESYARSAYTERNYFMIARNFCSLTSRLGYHFSIVEALVSERTAENYISFRFKGGAADSRRRTRRIRFIADILTDYGFRAERKRDNMVARVEGYDLDFMLERLRVLGYLILHTRQLDMIMANETAISYYRDKIDRDLRQAVLADPPAAK